MFKIIADARERAVISQHFKNLSMQHNIDFEVKTITTGDYAIIKDDTIIFIFERKTWQDLAASMRDGRKENVYKLLKLREETGCKIAYIIEGDPFPTAMNANRLCSRIPYKYLISHLDHLIYRDNIHVIHTKNEEDTAKRLFSITKNIISCKSNAQLNKVDECVEIHAIEDKSNEDKVIEDKPNEDKPNEDKSNDKAIEDKVKLGAMDKLTAKQESRVPIAEQILKCLPGVGSIISVALAENNVSIDSLFRGKHLANELAIIKYPSGASLGLKKAEQIVALPNRLRSISATAKKMQIRILYSIPLITKKTAAAILAKYSFASIMDGLVSLDQLKEINKTEKIKLGNKAAENILKGLLFQVGVV